MLSDIWENTCLCNQSFFKSLTTDYLMVGFRHKMLMGVDRIPFGYSGFLLSLKYPHKERIDSLISTFHELGIYQV